MLICKVKSYFRKIIRPYARVNLNVLTAPLNVERHRQSTDRQIIRQTDMTSA
jgi:hypothetical protein